MNNTPLMKSIFTCTFDPFSPLHVDADRLRMFNNDSLLADVFIECADMLVGLLESGANPTPPDRFLQPVLYLYRHALELDLKSVIRDAEAADVISLTKTKRDNLNRFHGLTWLWETARDDVVPHLGPDNPELTQELEKRLGEIDTIDPHGDAFRYSRDKAGTDSLERVPEFTDFGHFRNVVREIHRYLQGCLCILSEMKRDDSIEGI